MKLRNHIKNWANIINIEHRDYILESKFLLNESATPEDTETIEKVFEEGDISSEKFYPTREFLEGSYGFLNERLFHNHLPGNLILTITNSLRAGYVGCASYNINRSINAVTPLGIKLNGSVTLTLHEWLEVIVHEMIHIQDYQDYPDHFLGFYSYSYDAHGRWFMAVAEQFKEYGLNIERTCSKEIGVNVSDTRINRRIKKTSLIYFEGYKDAVISVSDTNLEETLRWIMIGTKHNRYHGLTALYIFKTDNPEIVKLKQTRMKRHGQGFTYWILDDDFRKTFGPLHEVRKYTMEDIEKELEKNGLTEDRDEVDYEEMNHIDDEYARKIYDNIEGVIDVKKTSEDDFEVTIW